MKHNTHSETEL